MPVNRHVRRPKTRRVVYATSSGTVFNRTPVSELRQMHRAHPASSDPALFDVSNLRTIARVALPNQGLDTYNYGNDDFANNLGDGAEPQEIILPTTSRRQTCVVGENSLFQIHLMPADLENTRRIDLATVTIFAVKFADTVKFLGSCTSCPGHSEEVQMYYGISENCLSTDAPALCLCAHITQAVALILTNLEESQKSWLECDLQQFLLNTCTVAAPDSIVGAYKTSLPAESADKYWVVVTPEHEFRLFQFHTVGYWSCVPCKKHSFAACGHLKECSCFLPNFTLNRPAQVSAARAMDPEHSPAQDFEKCYVYSKTLYDGAYSVFE